MQVVTQETRLIRLATPLGEDRLLLESFTGSEALSRPFRFELELLSLEEDLDLDALVGQPAALAIDLADGGERHFSGFIGRFAQGGSRAGFIEYRAELVPWLWFLTRTTDSRIFQNQTVPEIVTRIFDELGFTDYRADLLRGDYPRRTYCVQYRESDFAFVSRLLEDEGIFYFFEHGAERHTLVLADDPDDCPPCAGPTRVRYHLPDQVEEDDTITEWRRVHALRSGRVVLNDFNFEIPSTSLRIDLDSVVKVGGNDVLELHDYPGGYAERHPREEYPDRDQGERYTQLRMEEEEAQHRLFEGEGTCRGFSPGHRFELAEHYRGDNNQPYVLVEVRHRGNNNLTHTEGSANYGNAFTCIPAKVPFRPQRLTPKPVIQGPQTAIVVGPEGEEIHVDRYGRVKVRFHWDREDRKGENRSCWIRVAQSWAGKRWGGVIIPRIGMEVLVEFLEGDPDRPLITGCVYNAEAMPPYELPGEQTKTAFKTLSSKGGQGFNEIRFEDRKGEEQIFVHAEKNQDIRTKNDVYEWVGRNDHEIVKQDRFTHVENNRHETVDTDHLESIGNDRNLKVGGKEAKQVGGSLSLKVGGDVVEVFGANHSEEVTGDLYLKGMNVVVEATSNITLKVGGNAVVIDQVGVTISSSGLVTIMGSLVNINSGPGSPPWMAMPGFLVAPAAPTLPEEADVADPGEVAKIKAEQQARKTGKYGFQPARPFKAAASSSSSGGAGAAAAAAGAAVAGAPAPEEKKSFVEIELLDEEGQPVAGEKYRIKLPDGRVKEGTLDGKGFARVDGIDPGNCEITFPNLDREAWEPS